MNKENSAPLSFTVIARIGKQKHDELCSLLKNSTVKTMSELLRRILQQQPIRIINHDGSLEPVAEELSAIRKEIQAIGININQVTHRFHMEDGAEGRIFQALEIAKLYQQTDSRVTALLTIISKLSVQWWPE